MFQKFLNEDFRSTDPPELRSAITDLDETLKAATNDSPEDENVTPLDDEENPSVLIAESDVDEEIEQFNGNPSIEAQTVNLGEILFLPTIDVSKRTICRLQI